MNNKDVRVIYKKIEPNFLNKYGYINLNHRDINTKNDLVEITSIFRNPLYETFRILYMKDSKIVGHEAITSKAPNYVKVFPKAKNGKQNSSKCFYKIINRMERLNANGYYLVHNHPSGNAKASNDDLRLTEEFSNRIKGFKGHLIINLESYAWIDTDNYGIAHASNYLPIKKFKKDRIYKMMNKKSIYDVKINSRDDLVYLMHHIKNSQNYSTAILTDCIGRVRMILDIPNRFMNIPKEQLKGYFYNLSKLNGTSRVFFATTDNDTYKNSLQHFEHGTFTDTICYKHENNKIFVYEKVNVIKTNNIKKDIDIKCNTLSVKEDSTQYEKDTPLELLDVPKGKIRILFKAVGQPTKVMNIPNTLKSKQKLVGGLIEVVQYDDVLLICNEEGKILNMPPNLVFDYDYIAGNCFVIGDDYENGDFRSLTLDEIDKYRKDLESRSFKYNNLDDKSNIMENPSKER